MLKHVQHYSPNRNSSSSSIKRDAFPDGERLQINHHSQHLTDKCQLPINFRQLNIDLSCHSQTCINESNNQAKNSYPDCHLGVENAGIFLHPRSSLRHLNNRQTKVSSVSNTIPSAFPCTCPSSLDSKSITGHVPLSNQQKPSSESFGDLTCSSCSSSSSSSLSSIAQNQSSTAFKKTCNISDRKNVFEKGFHTRGRPPDNISLDSSMSCSSGSHQDERINSTSSSIDNAKQTTVRVWVRCLLQEMEYKTVCLSYSTTCRELVNNLLLKFKMKHRDPNLFYLAMEVTIRKADTEVRTCLRLEDDSFPAQLLACHPQEDSRLALRMRRGGLLRVYDGALSQGSNYKSLLVSDKTPCSEVVALVLACNKVDKDPREFTLYEVCEERKTDRALAQTDHPMLVANQWHHNWKARLEIRRLTSSLSKRQRIIELEKPPSMNFNLNDKNPNLISSVMVYQRKHVSTTINPLIEMDVCCTSESSASSICDRSSPGDSSSPLLIETDDEPNFDQLQHSRRIHINAGCLHDYQNVSSQVENRRRRKLPLPPDFVLLETVVDEDHPMTDCRRSSDTPSPGKSFKTYNDYENYFYI